MARSQRNSTLLTPQVLFRSILIATLLSGLTSKAELRLDSCCLTRATQSEQEATLLQQGKPIERELRGAQAHSYSLMLASDQYLSAVIDQRGIDVVVTLFAPDGQKLV